MLEWKKTVLESLKDFLQNVQNIFAPIPWRDFLSKTRKFDNFDPFSPRWPHLSQWLPIVQFPIAQTHAHIYIYIYIYIYTYVYIAADNIRQTATGGVSARVFIILVEKDITVKLDHCTVNSN